MSVIILLIIASIIMAGGFLIAFIWSVKDGQYEDNYSPANRILFEDKKPKKTEHSETKTENKTT